MSDALSPRPLRGSRARAITYLIDNTFVTGVVLAVDGGAPLGF